MLFELTILCLDCQHVYLQTKQDIKQGQVTLNLNNLAEDPSIVSCMCAAPAVGLRVKLIDQAEASPAIAAAQWEQMRKDDPMKYLLTGPHAEGSRSPNEIQTASIGQQINMAGEPIDALKQHRQDAFFDAHSEPATEGTC